MNNIETETRDLTYEEKLDIFNAYVADIELKLNEIKIDLASLILLVPELINEAEHNE